MNRRGRVSGAPAAPASFGGLACRVSGWTTNLIATGVILALAVGAGRQLVEWWRIAPEQVAPGAPLAALDPGFNPWAPCTLEFGDAPYSIGQQLAAGDRAAAVQQLLATCRRAAVDCTLPTEPPGEAEEQLLAAVQSLEPLQTTGGVRCYGPETGFPLVVAVARVGSAHEGSGSADRQIGADSAAATRPSPAATAAQLGASRDRVLVWGIAAPDGELQWSLYTFRIGEHRPAATADVPSVPLPPGSHRTMSLRDERGVTLLAFAGTGSADDWRQSLARWFSRSGWSAVRNWQLVGNVWHACYARSSQPGQATVEVQFGPEPGGRLAGLLRIAPAAASRVTDQSEREAK